MPSKSGEKEGPPGERRMGWGRRSDFYFLQFFKERKQIRRFLPEGVI